MLDSRLEGDQGEENQVLNIAFSCARGVQQRVSSTICSLSTRQFYNSESVYMQLNQTRNDKRRMYFQEKKLLRQLLFTQTQSGSGFTASEMAGSHNEYETHFITQTTLESVLQYFFTLLFMTCFNASFL